MTSIQARLLCIEDLFLSSVTEGLESVQSFDKQWAVLAQDVESAIQSSLLDDETMSLAHATFSRVAVLADVFHYLHTCNEKLSSDVMGEVEEILSQLTIAETLPRSPPKSRSCSSSSSSSADNNGHPSLLPGPPPHPHLYGDSHVSPTPSLVSLSTADESDEDFTIIPISGRKRSASSLDDSGVGHVSSDRKIKRLRMSHSAPPEVQDIKPRSDVVYMSPNDPLPVPLVFSPVNDKDELTLERQKRDSPSRKRRLSDADDHAVPKRPRGLPARPRLHTVSDPFPISSSPTEAQIFDEWFEVNLGTADTPSLSFEDVDPPVPVEVGFFNAWTSMGAVPIDSCLNEMDMPSRIVHPPHNDLQPDLLSSLDTSAILPSVSHYSVSAKSDAKNPPANLLVAEVDEPDVISMYTTLHDTDRAALSCNHIPQSFLDLSVDCPPTFYESDGENWAQFLAALDQPPEIVMPTPPPPYDLSPDVTCLLESLLQTVDVCSVRATDCTQVLSDKEVKMKELEVAKEAVRRLEAEVGATA